VISLKEANFPCRH